MSSKKILLISLLLASSAYFSIFRSSLFYIDDAVRVFSHTSINQGIHGRPLADVVYSVFSGGLFVDISPLSQVYALCFMLISIGMITHALCPSRDEIGFMQWLPLFFVLLPINTAVLCYRYDSLPMSFAILCAAGAFFLHRNSVSYLKFLFSVILLWCVLSSYQPMIGIFFCCCCLLFVRLILQEKNLYAVKKIILQIGATICAVICYLPIYFYAKKAVALPFCGLPNHPYLAHYKNISDFSNLFIDIFQHVYSYFIFTKIFWGQDIISFCIYAIFVLTIIVLLVMKIPVKNKCFAFCGILCAFFSCGLLEILLRVDAFASRTLVALGVLVVGLQCIIINAKIKWMHRLVASISILCMISSANILSALGNALRDQADFEEAFILQPLAVDLAALSQEKGPFSLAVRGQPPMHYSLSVLQHQYPYFSPPTEGSFLIVRFSSWLPIKYDLPLVFSDTDVSCFPLVVSRLAYDIRNVDEGKYVVILNSQYAPQTVEKFQQ